MRATLRVARPLAPSRPLLRLLVLAWRWRLTASDKAGSLGGSTSTAGCAAKRSARRGAAPPSTGHAHSRPRVCHPATLLLLLLLLLEAIHGTLRLHHLACIHALPLLPQLTLITVIIALAPTHVLPPSPAPAPLPCQRSSQRPPAVRHSPACCRRGCEGGAAGGRCGWGALPAGRAATPRRMLSSTQAA